MAVRVGQGAVCEHIESGKGRASLHFTSWGPMELSAFSVLALVAPPPSLTALRPRTPLRSVSPTCFFSERRITLTTVDEQRVLAALRALANKANRWRDGEWRVLGAPPLEFSLRTLPDGVRFQYFVASDAGRLTTDGAMDVTLRNRGIVWTSSGRARRRNEDVLFHLLLHELRAGSLSDCCSLAPGLYPPSAGPALLVARIDAACLVDKKVQYSRF